MDKKPFENENQSKSLIENEFEHLIISPEMEKNLLTTSNWSVFISIVGFIFAALMMMVGIAMFFLNRFTSEYQDFQSLPSGMMSYLGLLYFFIAILYFVPSLFLIQFALKTKKSIKSRSQTELELGFRNMKQLALTVGVLTIILIVMSFSIPVFVGIFTAAKQMGGM